MEEEKKDTEQPIEEKKPETEAKPETTEQPTIEAKEEVKVAERPHPEKPKFKVEMPKMKAPKISFSWKYVSIIAIILLVIILIWTFFLSGNGVSATITEDDAGELAVGYVTTELIRPGAAVDISVDDVTAEELYYAVNLMLDSDGDSQELEVYISKDGRKIFLGADDLAEVYEDGDVEIEAVAEPAAVEFPKTETPDVKLFVMSFCPFGTQAETGMAPVYELLKDSVDFNVHFIATVNGDDMESVRALHGPPEAEENARQLCIAEEYGKDELWAYLDAFATAYSNREVSTDNVDTAWKDIAESVDLDVATIESCYDDMAFELTEASAEVANEYGATGSPTLVINGEEYRGARTPEAYKTAICSAFEDAPEECDDVLTELDGADAAGNC